MILSFEKKLSRQDQEQKDLEKDDVLHAGEGIVGAFGGTLFDADFIVDKFFEITPDSVVANHGK